MNQRYESLEFASRQFLSSIFLPMLLSNIAYLILGTPLHTRREIFLTKTLKVMNSFENLGGDPSKLRARQGSKNLAWQCLRNGKGGGSSRLRMKLQASPTEESWTKTKTTKKKNERKGERGREYKMRVFGEKNIRERERERWQGDQWKGMRES